MTAEIFPPQRRGQYATLAQSTPLRSPKRTVGNPPPDHSSFCEFLYVAPRCQLAVRPVLRPWPALRVRSYASKYIHIDAFRCETVTRETLLRYTGKSAPVNNLISGNLWKKFSSAVRSFGQRSVWDVVRTGTHNFKWPRFSHGSLLLPVSRAKASLRSLRKSANRINLDFTPEQYAYRKSGFAFDQFIQPQEVVTTLRIVAEDPSTAEVGSLTIPLSQLK